MRMGFTLTGVREMDQRFDRIEKSVRRRQTQIAEQAAEIVAEEARRLVPVLTGELRDSIIVSATRLGGAFKMDMRTDGVVRFYVGPKKGGGHPDGFYGHMVEFGTINAGPHPFMRPAFDNTRGQVLKFMAAETWKSIVKVLH